MENETERDTLALLDMHPLAADIMPGTMSGAEMLELYERAGVFETFAFLNDLIGPDKQYADSTEYLLAMREKAARRGHETE